MSADEIIISLISMTVAGLVWARWYAEPRQIRRLRAADGGRLLDLAPVLSAVVLLGVLKTLSAHDVRDDFRYLGLYFLMGCAWVAVAMSLVPLGGISKRDDVYERGNRSAARVVAGAMVAFTLCFAGGNIGDGPGWWVVVISAAIATAGLFGAWLLVEAFTNASDTVTIDRDRAAGLRIAGFLIACGLILGRAVAGDWVSVEDTIGDFANYASPVLVLVAMAVVVERAARPTRDRPAPAVVPFGIVPALAYLAIAVAQVARLGIPE